MLKEYNEEDFKQLKYASSDRLRPDGISAGLIGALIYNGVMVFVSFGAVAAGKNYNFNPLWSLFVVIELLILLLEFFITIFYSNIKNAYRFQKNQIKVLCFIYFILSISAYPIYFITCSERKISSYMVIGAMILFIGGLLLLVTSTFRAIRRVRKGELRKGGKYLYDFSNSKVYYGFPISFGFIVLAGFISRTLSGMEGKSASIASVSFILVLCFIIQYALALALPEFFLLAYCKFRFPSFIEEIPKFLKLSKSEIKKLKNKKSNK